MTLPGLLRRVSRPSVVVAAMAVLIATAGLVVGANLQPPKFFTPNSENQVTNIDVLRGDLKNYYGDSTASTGSGASGGWTHALNQDSNYAAEARSVLADAWAYLAAKEGKVENAAIVLDVDDTTLATWNYELYSNWDYNPATNAVFVGLTRTALGPPPVYNWTGNLFPATPGMKDFLDNADAAGYAIFFITGRPDSQHNATIANLENDLAAGLADITTVDHTQTVVAGWLSTPVLPVDRPEIDVDFPAPTAEDIGHGQAYNGGNTFADGLFTKPDVGNYPTYLTANGFCTGTASCPTISYKSGTRAYIQSLGYEIVANFGDQYSDLLGGYADKTFKMPNPNYYLP